MILIVTGTGTDVGKTVATAALAVNGQGTGRHVTVVKPVQTGEEPGNGDLRTVTALTGVTDTHCFTYCPEPLAPVAAARRAGIVLPGLQEAARRILALDAPDRLVLVEGAGGVLVDLGGFTVADLARRTDAPVVVVTTTGLGSLNHHDLTLEALAHRGVTCAGVIGGSVPVAPVVPDAATSTTLDVLRGGPRWLGGIPAGAGTLDTAAFRAAAGRWIGMPQP
ncbi:MULTISPECIES: dethiobiotin synthase [unclassified Corynebacterium]|uniref:dethiobiotin synthase n=1 Tax=unclassified Corynebacterium TaxID=2624378 RepID=UPI004033D511